MVSRPTDRLRRVMSLEGIRRLKWLAVWLVARYCLRAWHAAPGIPCAAAASGGERHREH